MAEPRNVRRKSENQIHDQVGRIADAINERMRTATSERERQSLRNRYNAMADAFNDYIDNIHRSTTWQRAITRYVDENGSLNGIGEVLTNVGVPTKSYMRRRNNRR